MSGRILRARRCCPAPCRWVRATWSVAVRRAIATMGTRVGPGERSRLLLTTSLAARAFVRTYAGTAEPGIWGTAQAPKATKLAGSRGITAKALGARMSGAHVELSLSELISAPLARHIGPTRGSPEREATSAPAQAAGGSGAGRSSISGGHRSGGRHRP